MTQTRLILLFRNDTSAFRMAAYSEQLDRKGMVNKPFSMPSSCRTCEAAGYPTQF